MVASLHTLRKCVNATACAYVTWIDVYPRHIDTLAEMVRGRLWFTWSAVDTRVAGYVSDACIRVCVSSNIAPAPSYTLGDSLLW